MVEPNTPGTPRQWTMPGAHEGQLWILAGRKSNTDPETAFGPFEDVAVLGRIAHQLVSEGWAWVTWWPLDLDATQRLIAETDHS